MEEFSLVESAGADQWDLHAIVRQCNSCPESIISKLPSSTYACFDQPLSRHENEVFEALKTVNNGGIDDDCGKGHTRLQKQNSEGVAKERRRSRRSKQKTIFVQQFAGDRALSDHWNWRKYGQKSIKGSPFPRSYYKCSSSGDCLARKQVEHSRSDPGTFLISYINEHNHPYPTRRHSQAGRTKERFDSASSNKVTSTVESSSPNYSLTTSRPHSSPNLETPFQDYNDDHPRGLDLKFTKDHEGLISQEEDGAVVGRCGIEDNVDVLDMVWDDDFFANLGYLEGLEMDLLCVGDRSRSN